MCVVGSGYVGLIEASCFFEKANLGCCIDINGGVIGSLKNGKMHFPEQGLEQLVQRKIDERR